jgi:uncharacterized heparinase superfamily protein
MHDGYLSRFGLYHERALSLGEGGNVLKGIDRFFLSGGKPAKDNGRDFVSIRFHVHPERELAANGEDRLIISGRGVDTWVFTAVRAVPTIEESIFFAGLSGPRKTRQIVLSFKASEAPEVCWQFTRIKLASNESA